MSESPTVRVEDLLAKVVHVEAGDIIVIYVPEERMAEIRDFARELSGRFDGNLVVLLAHGMDLAAIPEDLMRNVGWEKVKKGAG
jgi:hypothetical protein